MNCLGEAGYRATNEDYKFFENQSDSDHLNSQLRSLLNQMKVCSYNF